MRTRYIPAGVMLVAGAVTCIISIVQKQETVVALKTLLVVLILFYIIGLITKILVDKILRDFAEKEIMEVQNDADGEENLEQENKNPEDVENSLDKNGKTRL